MEIKHLRYFKRVAELEHLTQAAKELYVSQSYLSYVISEMEDELGVKLFDRVGRGIVLNPCGQEFYREVVGLFMRFEDAKKKTFDVYKKHTTQLTIMTNAGTYMPSLISAISQVLPKISIRQLSGKRRKIARSLLDGDVDFAICCPILAEEPEIESYLLHTELGVVIYPAGHWLEGKEIVNIEDIADENFINVSLGYGTRDALDVYLQSKKIQLNSIIETSDTISIFDYVHHGLGIAFAPITMAKRHMQFKDRYVKVADSPSATIGLSWNKNGYIGEAGNAFVTAIKEFFIKL